MPESETQKFMDKFSLNLFFYIVNYRALSTINQILPFGYLIQIYKKKNLELQFFCIFSSFGLKFFFQMHPKEGSDRLEYISFSQKVCGKI